VEANNLREAFIAYYKPKECEGPCLTWCPEICMWPSWPNPRGPHPMGNWGAYIPLDYFRSVVHFMSIHKGNLDILVHPNSGEPVHDHDERALWLGTRAHLDLTKVVCEGTAGGPMPDGPVVVPSSTPLRP